MKRDRARNQADGERVPASGLARAVGQALGGMAHLGFQILEVGRATFWNRIAGISEPYKD